MGTALSLQFQPTMHFPLPLRFRQRHIRLSARPEIPSGRVLGADDAHADQYVPGSTKNYAADGSTLIGRIYALPLFGETAQAGTLYDANGKTNVVTIPLASPQAKPYSKVMRELYGTPTAVQNTPLSNYPNLHVCHHVFTPNTSTKKSVLSNNKRWDYHICYAL